MCVYIYLFVDMDIDDHCLHFIHFLPYEKVYNAISGWSEDREAGGHINVYNAVCLLRLEIECVVVLHV